MKISLNWLREYVAFQGDAAALAELLTLAGVEVEGIETRGVAIPNVVVAEVKESVQHPNADRLSVCQVDDGSGAPRQIVCGAKNYRVGDKVPLALPGAALPGDFKIKVGKLRGMESQGMMCSADELGLPKGEDGLLILPPESIPGTPLSELYPGDTIMDLEITPNRPDLLSHIGIAREVSALSGSPILSKRVRNAEADFSATVEISAENCPLYTVRQISGVKVGPSPAWMKNRLEAVGLRSINNIVDITNYVMMETGQPLHAFDAAKVRGDIRVRLAATDEAFKALDGKQYTLQPSHLVIADEAGVLALAGVMGGEESGVSAATTEIWLESAYFLPTNIRATSRGLGLMTDSSYRFERDVDPAGILSASQRATQLIAELAGGIPGKLRSGYSANAQFGFDVMGAEEGIEYGDAVPLRAERCTALLGFEVSDERIAEILTGFGLRKSMGGWQIPSFRPDLTREVDLIEEIARVVGIQNIPARTVARFAQSSETDRLHDRLMLMRQKLASWGFHESRTLTLISEANLKNVYGTASLQRVRNPLNEDQAVLRPSLIPGLLDSLARNARVGEKAIRLFEIGRVFSDVANGVAEERLSLGLILSGESAEESWRGGEGRTYDVYDIKGAISAIFGNGLRFDASPDARLAISTSIGWKGSLVGRAGQLWPVEARSLDITSPVIFAEIDLTAFMAETVAPQKYREIPRYPAVRRDIALLAPLELPHAAIQDLLLSGKEPLLAWVELFDIFTDPSGEKVPIGQKSVAYSLTYRATERTLTADEVNAAHSRLKELLKSSLPIGFRE